MTLLGIKLSSSVVIIWNSTWLIPLTQEAFRRRCIQHYNSSLYKVFHRLLWIRMNNIYNALYSLLNTNLKHSFLNSLSSILPPGGTTNSWVNSPSFHTCTNMLTCLSSSLVAHPPSHLHTLIFQKYIWIKKMVLPPFIYLVSCF